VQNSDCKIKRPKKIADQRHTPKTSASIPKFLATKMQQGCPAAASEAVEALLNIPGNSISM
jgi:hypothetical protein